MRIAQSVEKLEDRRLTFRVYAKAYHRHYSVESVAILTVWGHALPCPGETTWKEQPRAEQRSRTIAMLKPLPILKMKLVGNSTPYHVTWTIPSIIIRASVLRSRVLRHTLTPSSLISKWNRLRRWRRCFAIVDGFSVDTGDTTIIVIVDVRLLSHNKRATALESCCPETTLEVFIHALCWPDVRSAVKVAGWNRWWRCIRRINRSWLEDVTFGLSLYERSLTLSVRQKRATSRLIVLEPISKLEEKARTVAPA